MEIDDVIKAAVKVITEPMLRLLQDDPHQWSDRPCPTCRPISSMIGADFGCSLYAERRRIQKIQAAKERVKAAK